MGKNVVERDVITAESAKSTATCCEKLKHIISRNIKEEAEQGKCRYVFISDNLAEGVEETIVNTFTDRGFVVHSAHEEDGVTLSTGSVILQNTVTYFVFEW